MEILLILPGFWEIWSLIVQNKCLDFVDAQGQRVSDKFFQLIEIIEEVKIVRTNFVKKHIPIISERSLKAGVKNYI